jgi:hypothetical protein
VRRFRPQSRSETAATRESRERFVRFSCVGCRADAPLAGSLHDTSAAPFQYVLFSDRGNWVKPAMRAREQRELKPHEAKSSMGRGCTHIGSSLAFLIV